MKLIIRLMALAAVQLALIASPAAAQTGQDAASVSPARSTAEDYRLGASDRLRIVVFGEDNLSGEFSVSGDGRISLPLIGDVPASGKTVREVQDEIIAALKNGYLKDPRVSAEVLSFRPFYIFGEVLKPGEYPYSDGITAMNAIASSGGFTYRANQKFVFIKRANETAEHRVPLKPELRVAPGDTLRVSERFF